jgi:hypothetical protein
MSDFGMSSFLNNQQNQQNSYNAGIREHNADLDNHLTDQINKLKGDQKTTTIGDVLTHTQDVGREAYLTSEFSDAYKRYGQYKKNFDVDGQGHVEANKQYLSQNMKNFKDKYHKAGDEGNEEEPLSSETREGTELRELPAGVPAVRPDPRGARLTISEDPSDLQENQEEGHNGDTGAENDVDELPQARVSQEAGAGSDVSEAGTLGSRIKAGVSKATGVSEEGLDVASYGAKKMIGGGLALTNTIEDISSGHLQGDNWEEKVGDVGQQIGGALDLIGTAIPVLEPLGAGISVVSGLLEGIGHIVDDFKHKDPVDTKTLTDKSNALKLNSGMSNSYQQMGLVSSVSKNPKMMMAGTSVF